MSEEEEDKKKKYVPTDAAKAKDPTERAKELYESTEKDRKKTALTMKADKYSFSEIAHALKEVSGDGINPSQLSDWEQEDKKVQEVGLEAEPVLTAAEKAFAAMAAAKMKGLDEKFWSQVLDYGLYVFECVTPMVPAKTPEEKAANTQKWLKEAVEAFDPEEMMEIRKFGAAAFLAMMELKEQMTIYMSWADPSSRLQNMAEKALYSKNPVNKDAFDLLMLKLVESVNQVPRFTKGQRLSEIPRVIKAYAEATGTPEDQAEKIYGLVLKEVKLGE